MSIYDNYTEADTMSAPYFVENADDTELRVYTMPGWYYRNGAVIHGPFKDCKAAWIDIGVSPASADKLCGEQQ